MEGEIEVYRMTDLIVDKCYITVFNTRQEGDWRNRRYYSSLEPTYVGKYIKNTRWGYGDGSGITWTFFNDMTNEEVEVRGDYEGRTCFKEVECEDDKLKREKSQSGLSIIVPFYNLKFKKEKKLLIAKILDVYRIPILRNA